VVPVSNCEQLFYKSQTEPSEGLEMIRPIFIAALMIAATGAQAQRMPNPQKLETCRQLARERGFKFGAFNKGAIKPKDFVRGCMQGTQR
jgi:hypothetical protein